MSDHAALRAKIIGICRRMNAAGLNQGTAGNVSARVDGGFLITPSGMPYDQMEPGQLPLVDFDGNYSDGRAPSSEWRMHFAILKARADAGAVIHAHAPFATALSCLRKDIPAFHYMVAVAGGRNIRCARYATFGGDALARHMLTALEGRKACLLANHGMICFERDLERAWAMAIEVEALAAQYWRALQIGAPIILSDGEMARVLKQFETYGGQAAPATPEGD